MTDTDSFTSSTTHHYDSVKMFMEHARQVCPDKPTIPTEDVRILRIMLVIEEALELAVASGVRVALKFESMGEVTMDHLQFAISEVHQPNIVEVADACADIAVVTTGTLIAYGLKDRAIQDAVNQNNMDKFRPGHSWSPKGKLIKPPDHKKVDLAAVIAANNPPG